MCYANDEKRKTTNDGNKRTPKSRRKKIRTLGEKETNKYLGILEMDTIKHAEIKEKIN